MKKGDIIWVFQDGKLCRGEEAEVLELRAGGIKVIFPTMEPDETATVWFRRRDRKGKYEAFEWNYWILPTYSITGYQQG